MQAPEGILTFVCCVPERLAWGLAEHALRNCSEWSVGLAPCPEAPFLSRACSCMAPRALGKHCWPGLWLTTQTAPSFVSLALNWYRNSSGKVTG